jgi:signal peptidase
MMKTNDQEKQIQQKISATLVTLLLIAAVCLCLYVSIQVLGRGYASFGGYSVFRVVTGSMEPSIPEGALTLTKQTDIQDIEIGDIICFRSKSPTMIGKTITHRVIDVFQGAQGEILLKTQGDANTSYDEYYVTSDNLVGKVIWHSKSNNVFSKTVGFFSNKYGFLACIALPCLLFAGMILRDCVKNIKNDMKRTLELLAQQDVDSQRMQEQSRAGEQPPQEQAPPQQKTETYDEMRERIRAELIEELKQNNGGEQSKTE